MVARLAVVVMLGACSYPSLPALVGGDAGDASAGTQSTDAALADAATPLCYGSYATVCFDAAADLPNTAKMFAANTDVDTDSTDAATCNQSHDQKTRFCVIAGAGITIATGATLRAHGSKPLVLISTTAVDLEGNIDVSSSGGAAATQGAGANPPLCMESTPALGASGGAGGSFAGTGGDGEAAGSDPTSPPAPAIGFPTMLRGGCPGGSAPQGVTPGGAGGAGGGAVAIVAPNIAFNGTINTSGAGGGGGARRLGNSAVGGGGGGSGGMIVLEALPEGTVRGAAGLLIANGGGGGEGGGGQSGQDGSVSTQPTPGAPGGDLGAGTTGGIGGTGSAGSASLGGGDSPSILPRVGFGGGGGGGGAGFIHAPDISGDAIISPPSQDLPPPPELLPPPG